jgi:IS30 family transposase
MQKRYHHLSYEERVKIDYMKQIGMSVREIARRLCRGASTISREINRNTYVQPGYPKYPRYFSRHAEVKAMKRRRRAYRKYPRVLLKSNENQEYVAARLLEGWSPELIAGRMKREDMAQPVSYESIYQWLYKERVDLVDKLVRRHRRRRWRGQSKKHRTKRFADVSTVHDRPENVSRREEFGHWESDSMVSDQSLAALHVVVERKSRYAVISGLERNTADAVKRVLIRKMKKLPAKARASFTYDRGCENALHEQVNRSLKSSSYFCLPYRGWEKGTVENTIGIIRRSIRKKTDLGRFTRSDLSVLQSRLNDRPRKCLDFRTPSEVFNEQIVALQC